MDIEIGKFTLESLTTGMYTDPEIVYREYIQNSVDALDEAVEKGVKEAVGTLIVEFDSFGKAPLVENVTLEQMAERYKKAGI